MQGGGERQCWKGEGQQWFQRQLFGGKGTKVGRQWEEPSCKNEVTKTNQENDGGTEAGELPYPEGVFRGCRLLAAGGRGTGKA